MGEHTESSNSQGILNERITKYMEDHIFTWILVLFVLFCTVLILTIFVCEGIKKWRTERCCNEKGCFCKRKELNCDEDGDCEGVRHNSEAISAYTPTLIRLGYNLNTKNDSFLNSTDDLFK